MPIGSRPPLANVCTLSIVFPVSKSRYVAIGVCNSFMPINKYIMVTKLMHDCSAELKYIEIWPPATMSQKNKYSGEIFSGNFVIPDC